MPLFCGLSAVALCEGWLFDFSFILMYNLKEGEFFIEYTPFSNSGFRNELPSLLGELPLWLRDPELENGICTSP